MTKAERIFRNTLYECISHIRIWGLEYNPDGSVVSFNGLIGAYNESIPTRTCNDVRKQINSEKKRIELVVKYKVRTPEEMQYRVDALKMVEAAVDNQLKANKAE